jgi:hypothetical protein
VGIQALARGIRASWPFPNWPEAIESFLRSRWVYIPDPSDSEFIRSPLAQLREYEQHHVLVGDCDDAATIACSLLAAVNYPCWFSAIRMPGVELFEHVYAQTEIVPGEILDIDPTVTPDRLPIDGFEEQIIVRVL